MGRWDYQLHLKISSKALSLWQIPQMQLVMVRILIWYHNRFQTFHINNWLKHNKATNNFLWWAYRKFPKLQFLFLHTNFVVSQTPLASEIKGNIVISPFSDWIKGNIGTSSLKSWISQMVSQSAGAMYMPRK